MKIAVFGGAGFIGSHFVDKVVASEQFEEVLIIDSLTYAGNQRNISASLVDPRVKFLKSDILDSSKYQNQIKNFDCAVNFAAESHVDRSIDAPLLFSQVNALGASVVVNTCMKENVGRLIQVSTDEVYGPVVAGESTESALIVPTSPYSASKAAAEVMVMAYWRTFQYPVLITRGCNTYGPRQFPEKLIPLAISRFKENLPVPQYGNGQQIREWIHVEDHADAILTVALNGKAGETYNIGTRERIANRDILEMIASSLQADRRLITQVEDRPAHDLRYALDSSKIMDELDWKPLRNLPASLAECSNW